MIGRDYFIIALFVAAMVISAVVYTKTDKKIERVAEIDLAKDSVLTVKDSNERVYRLIIQQKDSTIRFVMQDKAKTEMELKDVNREVKALSIKVVQLETALDSNRTFIHSLRRVKPD